METVKFEEIIRKAEALLRNISAKNANMPYAPGKWKRIEMLGHLVDSAANNNRRFILAQINDSLIFEGYAHQDWVKFQKYETASWNNLITFWVAYNMQIIHHIANIPDEKLSEQTVNHNLHDICMNKLSVGSPANLKYLINDYFEHMQHHLDQILG